MNPIIIFVVLIVLLLVYGIYLYNRFVVFKTRTEEAWADIDTQLKRRYDLVPNLVETVKGYAAHEQQTFENVTKARAQAISAGQSGDPNAMAEADNMLTDALKTVFAVAEAYPDLKANQNFLELQKELSDTENKIQAARRFYNGNVRDLNTAVESFPSNLIAQTFGIGKKHFFELDEAEEKEAREPVKVTFNESNNTDTGNNGQGAA